MLNLKKTAIAVLALGSSAVFAGSMGPVCSAVNVTVPCENTAWDFGAKALYLQPGVSSGSSFERTVSTNNGSRQFGKNPQWNWGFMIEGSYHFNTGNDVNLNWYHLSNSASRSFAAGTIGIPVFDGITTTTITPGAGSVSVDPHWDAVNLEVGQHVDFGENKSIRFHGGAQYVRLTNNSTSVVAGTISETVGRTTTTGVFGDSSTFNPSYNGFGPRAGADMAYDWGNGLGIYAKGAAAVLAGSSKFNSTSVDVAGHSVSVSGSKTTIVPELEAKLGATYTYAMAQGDLTLDAGWMWVNYFSVHQDDAIVTGLGAGSDHDFGLQGPFIGLTWLGNVA